MRMCYFYRVFILILLLAGLLCACAGEACGDSVPQSTPPQETGTPTPTGWQSINGRRHYLLPDGSAFSGWLILEDGRYYLDADGAAVTGKAEIEGQQYFFDGDGRMLTGVITMDAMYLYGSDGTLSQPGWIRYEENTYYVIEGGVIYTGWLRLGEYDYYLTENGPLATGRTEINGKLHYFTPEGIHVLLVNPWHFLPEGYAPELATVRGYQVDTACAQALEQMLVACEKAGNQPQICSAYRSQETQERLFDKKVRSYTSKGRSQEEAQKLAGTEVAFPGTSEHQLGLAVDIVDKSNWNLDETQAKTPTQLWLMENCWEYGFILRYPNEKSVITGIIYEPWHYRYVGKDISMALKNSGLCLEEYLDAVTE